MPEPGLFTDSAGIVAYYKPIEGPGGWQPAGTLVPVLVLDPIRSLTRFHPTNAIGCPHR